MAGEAGDAVPTRRRRRPLGSRAAYSAALIGSVLVLGTLGMHAIEGWSYLNAFYFTSFIATGQGPPPTLDPLTDTGKVFAAVLAFVSVGSIVTALLYLFGPFLGEALRAGERELEKVGREIEGEPGSAYRATISR